MVASQTDGVMLLILYKAHKALAATRNTIAVPCQADWARARHAPGTRWRRAVMLCGWFKLNLIRLPPG